MGCSSCGLPGKQHILPLSHRQLCGHGERRECSQHLGHPQSDPPGRPFPGHGHYTGRLHYHSEFCPSLLYMVGEH